MPIITPDDDDIDDGPDIETAIWDIETNGLMDTVSRVHCLVIRDYERRRIHRYRRNSKEDTIRLGIRKLRRAKRHVGHNLLQYDIPVMEKLYPEEFEINGKITDTLVMARMCFSDQKEKDFRLWERGVLPGALIGSQDLESWGFRLGLLKGTYKKMMEDQGLDPWANWSIEMEDYCEIDTDVTTLLFERIEGLDWPRESVVLEHQIHDLMGREQENGIYFDTTRATLLAADLRNSMEILSDTAKKHFGIWYAPAKKWIVKPQWIDEEGKNEKKEYRKPRTEWGEDMSRAVWADVVEIGKTIVYKDPTRASRYAGDLFCPIKLVEFNPMSRDQIIDRFTVNYGWNPTDFTETGRPSVDDDVLRVLAGEKQDPTKKASNLIPIAKELAEVFYYKKRLGQIADGKKSWLSKVTPEGKIHHYCNVGGTVSGRASHVDPNLGQVPAVMMGEELVKLPDGTEKKIKKILKGREGDHGFECRELFYVPPPYKMVGCDMSGIELRCLGAALKPFDGGAYLDIVLNGDPHTYNQNLAGLPTRAKAKTFIYALIYGAGDVKLGSIYDPLAPIEEQAEIGARLRKIFMDNLPAYGALIKQIHRFAKSGYIPGMDGRRLYVRSRHSALNTKLQSDAALLAKKWCLLSEQNLLAQGWNHGWGQDFVFLLWIHDEIQIASKTYPEQMRDIIIDSAKQAGLYFGFGSPVDAEGKIGQNWAETH